MLPSKHEIVKLLIKKVHLSCKHAGVLTTMVELRKYYWILKCRKTVKSVLNDCFRCKRFSAKPATVPNAPLPLNRLEAHRVFEHCGIDCLGPLYLREGKVWILIITCCVFRAIHLEILSSLSCESFLMDLRRKRQNGTNFQAAYNLLDKLDWDHIKKHTAAEKINWRFNPPAAPWWGGFFERLVRCVKENLKRNLGTSTLSYEELLTIVAECEGIINQRPLTYLAEEDTFIPLTPAMFMNNIYRIETFDLDNLNASNFSGNYQKAKTLEIILRTDSKKNILVY